MQTFALTVNQAPAITSANTATFVLNVAGVTTFIERHVWARIQSRVGPNRVGPQGILQWLADGIKIVLEVKDEHANKVCEVARTVMEKAMLPAVQLKVPLVVEARAGKNWDEAH